MPETSNTHEADELQSLTPSLGAEITDPADAFLDEEDFPKEVLTRLAEADAVASETGEADFRDKATLQRLAEADKGVEPVLKPIDPLNQSRRISESEINALREIMQDPTSHSNLEEQALLNQARNEFRQGLLTDVPEDIRAKLVDKY